MAHPTRKTDRVPSKKKLLWILVPAVVLVIAAVCTLLFLLPGDAEFSVTPGKTTLEIGQTQKLTLVAPDGSKQGLPTRWYSEIPTVASVNKDGVVTASAAGTTKVTAIVTYKGMEHAAAAFITVAGENGDRLSIEGDTSTQWIPDPDNKFILASASAGVLPNAKEGSIQIQNVVSNTEMYFGASATDYFADAWEIRGTITKESMADNLFLSFGVKDIYGKDQWFCMLEDHISLQRYWDWWSNEYEADNVHVGVIDAAVNFYNHEREANGLDFILVLKDDVLKLYFGNEAEAPQLAWSLPLTEKTFGGYEAGSKYQIGINTVDPLNMTISDISVKTGEDVKDLGGVVGGKNADVRVGGNLFKVYSTTTGVSYNATQGTMTIKRTADKTETWFAAGQGKNYDPTWEMSGTIAKEKISDSVFLSFGVRSSGGRTQWFCIYEDSLSLQRYSDWKDTKQKTDGANVIFSQPACSFFWKEAKQGGDKLQYKLIISEDVLYAYFGNDKYDMKLAWTLPLTVGKYGGFATGSSYQLGINTVDKCWLNMTGVSVKTGAAASVVPDYVEGSKFILLDKTSNVTADPVNGTITVDKSLKETEMVFAASSNKLNSDSWEFSGTIKKEQADNVFLSFGVKDASGKDQWFCILDDSMALQRYWNWWDTKQPNNNRTLFYNQASTSFFYRETDNLNYKLILKDDVLYAYFGSDTLPMTLTWKLPLTNENYGGFAAGSKYKLAMNIVDPNNATISEVVVKTGDEVKAPEDAGTDDTSNYKYFVDGFSGDVTFAPENGEITYGGSSSNTQVYFASSETETYAKSWELTGTVTKNNISSNLFMSFGVLDSKGGEQWFCIYNTEKGISLKPTWNWADAEYLFDGEYVWFNQANCSFFWKEIDSMKYKLIVKDDVLYAYFGTGDVLSMAWKIPLTDSTFGGFADGSDYQLGIYTVDPCPMTITDITYKTGDDVVVDDNDWDWYKADVAEWRAKEYAALATLENPTLFIGDSFFDIEFWDKFYTDFDGKNAIIEGIGGTTAEDWINYIEYEIFMHNIQPKNIVINIGNNDVYTYKNADIVVRDAKELVELIHKLMPNTNIYFFSVVPRANADKSVVIASNEAMSAWCGEPAQSYITWINVYDEITTDRLGDGIHPKDEYYVSVYLKKLLEAGCVIEDGELDLEVLRKGGITYDETTGVYTALNKQQVGTGTFYAWTGETGTELEVTATFTPDTPASAADRSELYNATGLGFAIKQGDNALLIAYKHKWQTSGVLNGVDLNQIGAGNNLNMYLTAGEPVTLKMTYKNGIVSIVNIASGETLTTTDLTGNASINVAFDWTQPVEVGFGNFLGTMDGKVRSGGGTISNVSYTNMNATYAIAYEGLEGADNSGNPVTYIPANADSITLVNPGERAGYTFAGWMYNGKRVTTLAGLSGEITLTATWARTDATYSITYIDGHTHSNPVTYNMDSAADITLTPASRNGYIFMGWYIEDVYTETLAGHVGNLTVTAKWLQPAGFGGGGTLDTTKYMTPTDKGYTTNGADVEFEYYFLDKVYSAFELSATFNLTKVNTGAVWRSAGFVISQGNTIQLIKFNRTDQNSPCCVVSTINGTTWTEKSFASSFSMAYQTDTVMKLTYADGVFNIYDGSENLCVSLTLAELNATCGTMWNAEQPFAVGFGCGLWAEATFTNVVYTDLTNPGESYTITYELDGGANPVGAPTKYTDVNAANVVLPTPIRDGYKFLGWYIGDTQITSLVGKAENLTLTAKWKEQASGITYDEVTGIYDVPNSDEISDGTYFAWTGKSGTDFEVTATFTPDVNQEANNNTSMMNFAIRQGENTLLFTARTKFAMGGICNGTEINQLVTGSNFIFGEADTPVTWRLVYKNGEMTIYNGDKVVAKTVKLASKSALSAFDFTQPVEIGFGSFLGTMNNKVRTGGGTISDVVITLNTAAKSLKTVEAIVPNIKDIEKMLPNNEDETN